MIKGMVCTVPDPSTSILNSRSFLLDLISFDNVFFDNNNPAIKPTKKNFHFDKKGILIEDIYFNR